MGRPLRVTARVVAGLAVGAVLTVAVLLSTGPGHRVVRRMALDALNGAIDGHATAGSLGGMLWRGATLDDVVLAGADGVPVIRAGRVRVAYALTDLLRGRYVLRTVELVRPTVVIEQLADGTWNYQHLFRLLDTTRTPSGRRPLVDLQSVTIADGTFVLRRRSSQGAVDTRRLLGVQAELRLRASDPEVGGISGAVSRLEARLDSPLVALTGADGSFAVDGDSARFDFTEIALAGTQGSLAGQLRWGGPHVTGTFTTEARRFAFADLRGLAPSLPRTGGGRGHARLALLPDGGWTVDVREADIASGRSRVAGALRLARGARGGVTVIGADLALRPLDLATLGPWVDSLPPGILTGRVRARGAGADLTLDLAVQFRDGVVAGHPTSQLTGHGRVTLGGADGLVMHGFVLQNLDVASASLHRRVRTLPDSGRFRASGTLEGPWRNFRLDSAVITHAEGGVRPTVLRGAVQVAVGTVTRFGVQLRADTLSLDLMARWFPGLPVRGWATGSIHAEGSTDSVDFTAVLRGPWGVVAGAGHVDVRPASVAVRATGSLAAFDLHAHVPQAPPTLLSGAWRVDWVQPTGDSAPAGRGTLMLAVDTSMVAGVRFARAGGSVAVSEQRLAVDSAWLERTDIALRASGFLGRAGATPGQVVFTGRADSLAVLAPLVHWAQAARGDSTPAESTTVPNGAFRLVGQVDGTTDAWDLTATLDAPDLAYGSSVARAVRVTSHVVVRPDTVRGVVNLAAASATAAGLTYDTVRVVVDGTTRRFGVRVSGGFALNSSLRASLAVGRDSGSLDIAVDSLGLILVGRRWQMADSARVTVRAESIAAYLDLRAVEGGGRLTARGSLPRKGVGDFSVTADSVPLADLYALTERDTAGIGGHVSLGAHMTGSKLTPIIDLSIELADGRIADFRSPLLLLLGRYGDRRLTLKGGLWRDSVRVLALNVSLPVDLSLQTVAERRLPGALTASARTDGVDLALLNAVTSLVDGLSGTLAANLSIEGAWGSYDPRGFVAITNGALTIPSLNARYSAIDARFDVADSVIRVTRAELRSGGTLSATGQIRLEELRRPVLDLRLEAQRFAALNVRDFAGMTATGSLRLRGPAIGATLSGALAVDEGFLAFADLVEKRIVSLDDPEFRSLVEADLANAAALAPGIKTVFIDSLRIDSLRVDTGNDLWLRSSEANIQLTGEILVSRSIEGGMPRYRLDGTLNAGRGTYRLALGGFTSREFRVSRGTVRFFGTTDFDPDMDIVAEHAVRLVDGNQLMVRALIGGTLLTPVLRLESDQRPPLTETEIVSYLMFGRPSFQLAGGTGARSEQRLLASAVTEFAGFAAGQLEQSLSALGLPLDYLSIRPGSGASQTDLVTGARIEAGTQIGNRTFLTVNAGLCEARQRQVGLAIQYRFTPVWSVEASYEPLVQQCRGTGSLLQGASMQLGFDLFWQKR